jgi:hypothetical protein
MCRHGRGRRVATQEKQKAQALNRTYRIAGARELLDVDEQLARVFLFLARHVIAS